MPTLDDIAASATDKSKQQLQEALLELLKGNPDILDSVTKSTTGTDRQYEGGRSSDRSEGVSVSFTVAISIQLNHFNTDIKGTGKSVCIMEVSICQR